MEFKRNTKLHDELEEELENNIRIIKQNQKLTELHRDLTIENAELKGKFEALTELNSQTKEGE